MTPDPAALYMVRITEPQRQLLVAGLEAGVVTGLLPGKLLAMLLQLPRTERWYPGALHCFDQDTDPRTWEQIVEDRGGPDKR